MSEQHTPGRLKVAEGTDRWSAVYDGYGSSATRGLAIEGGHIIALAVEHNANLFSDPDPMENARRLVADLMAAHEREACALVAEDGDHVVDVPGWHAQLGDANATARNIAAAIRARGAA